MRAPFVLGPAVIMVIGTFCFAQASPGQSLMAGTPSARSLTPMNTAADREGNSMMQDQTARRLLAFPGHDAELVTALWALGLTPQGLGSVDPRLRRALIRLPRDWQASYAQETLKARATDLRRLITWAQEEGLAPLADQDQLAAVIDTYLLNAGETLGPASFKRVATHLVAFLQGLGLPETSARHRARMQIRSQNRAARARRRDLTDRSDTLRLTGPQIQALGLAIRDAEITDLMKARDLAILALMSELLLRRSEITGLRLVDWDAASGQLRIAHAKTDQEGRGIIYALSPGAQACLQDWLHLSGLDATQSRQARARTPIFVALHKSGGLRRGRDGALTALTALTGRSIARALRTHGERAGIEGIAGHTLRRSVARLLHVAGMTEAEIQEAGRWSSLEVMRGYVGLTPARQGAGAVLAQMGVAA